MGYIPSATVHMNITFEKLTAILKKNLATLLAVALLCFCGAFAVMKLFVPASYYTTADFYIKDSKYYSGTSTDISKTRLLADTFILILDTNNFFQNVHRSLPADVARRYDSTELRESTSFVSLNDTEVIRVSFESHNEGDVTEVANTILSCIQPYLVSTYGDCEANLVDSPVEPEVSSTQTSTVSILVAVIGVAVAFCVFLFRDILDVHIRSAAALSERYKVPILGAVPEFDKSQAPIKKKRGVSENGKNDN